MYTFCTYMITLDTFYWRLNKKVMQYFDDVSRMNSFSNCSDVIDIYMQKCDCSPVSVRHKITIYICTYIRLAKTIGVNNGFCPD